MYIYFYSTHFFQRVQFYYHGFAVIEQYNYYCYISIYNGLGFTILFLRFKSVPAMTIQHCFHHFSFVHYLFFLFYIECSVGFYGVNCLQNCSMACGIPGNCDRITGYCHGGCQRGWTGVRCEEGKG